MGITDLTHNPTSLKHSEDLLPSGEKRLTLMMESLTDYAIFSIDTEGIIHTWNKGAESMFGYSQDEILGRSHEILFPTEDVTNVVGMSERAALIGGNIEIESAPGDGTTMYVRVPMSKLI